MVDKGLRGDAADIVKAGYNLRGKLRVITAWTRPVSNAGPEVVLMGPEQNVSVLADQMTGVKWDGTGVGYGVRGSNLQDLTIRFEGKPMSNRTGRASTDLPSDIIQLYRQRAPVTPIMFNYSPFSALWAIQRHFPLSSNCTDTPGKDLVRMVLLSSQ